MLCLHDIAAARPLAIVDCDRQLALPMNLGLNGDDMQLEVLLSSDGESADEQSQAGPAPDSSVVDAALRN
eukprot:2931505-Lingulodinium_polyedra.AAC.1